MGFMVPEDTPMIWRGPMVMSAINQMLRDVEWGELDILVVDLPPGTGDAQLTMAQQVPLAGAVIVSTPQDIALLDARKGLNMFRKVDVPVLGIIENMSYFLCPHCGERSDIFSHGGARREAERSSASISWARCPLDMAIRETSDGGRPIVVAAPDSGPAKTYRAIAEQVWHKVQGAAGQSGPEDRDSVVQGRAARPRGLLLHPQHRRQLAPFALAEAAQFLGHLLAGDHPLDHRQGRGREVTAWSRCCWKASWQRGTQRFITSSIASA